MIQDSLKQEIVNRIGPEKPYKVFLFGSHAHGKSDENSDIDLLVVLNKEGVPSSYKEKSTNYLKISRCLRSMNKRIPMDLLVMTKTEWEVFLEHNSGFSREIRSNGIELL